ncbi:MAG: hypothetical protein ACK5AZ_22010 [Bryobacteraceae bacterium]
MIIRSAEIGPSATYTRSVLGSHFAALASGPGAYLRQQAVVQDRRLDREQVRFQGFAPAATHVREGLGTNFGARASGPGAYLDLYLERHVRQATGTFEVEASQSVEWQLGLQAAAFEVDALHAVLFAAPQPSSFWNCHAGHGVEFAGAKVHVAEFEVDVQHAAEFQGSAGGGPKWRVSADSIVEWIVRSGAVGIGCLGGEGEFEEQPDEENYVF